MFLPQSCTELWEALLNVLRENNSFHSVVRLKTCYMKKLIFSCLLITVIIIACKSSRQHGLLLQKPGDIPADEYVINIDKDTTLVTKNGALLKIPKGALQSGGSTVTLEIKEAYTAEQMIKSGLTTQSNGELLSSGAMIYINAKAGQEVKITQAIKVALPTGYLDSSMKLFKGEPDADGNINWKDPSALPENPLLAGIERGRVLFMNKCATCHAIGKPMTGPDLANILKRKDLFSEGGGYPDMHDHYIEGHSRYSIWYYNGWKEYYSSGDTYVQYDKEVYKHYSSQGCYNCNLLKLFGSQPSLFPELKSESLLDIYRYIQNESDRRNLPMPSHIWLEDCVDSCAAYYNKIEELKYQKEMAKYKQDTAKKGNGSMVTEEKNIIIPPPDTTTIVDTTIPPPVNFDEKVSPENYEAVYYQFTIETFGWYNIDVLMKGYDGVQESELFVRIQGQYREKVQVYLIIPSVKIYVQGGPAERNKEEFAFQYKTGKINLPQGTSAYILAVSESESSVAFTLKQFTTGLKQEFTLELKSASKEEFSEAIKSLNTGDINISVKDAKNADEIRKTGREIKNIDSVIKNAEQLKPKNCDCDCSNNYNVSTQPAATDTAKEAGQRFGQPK